MKDATMKLIGDFLAVAAVLAGGTAVTWADTDISATNPKAAAAISAVRELCLAGSQFDLKADVSGNLTLVKLAPGGQGSVSVNVRNSAGAAAIFDDKVRQVADEDIRTCIKPYIAQIVSAILGGTGADSNSYTWVNRPSSDQPPLGPFPGCRCAGIDNTPSGVTVTNGCSGDLPVTAVRGDWTPPAQRPPDPRYPWALIPAPGREYANVTVKPGKSLAFENAKQAFLWVCPNL